MSTRKETIRVCDQCGKEQRHDADYHPIGGHIFSGWFHLSEHGGSTTLEALRKKLEHDFCGKACLVAHLSGATDGQGGAKPWSNFICKDCNRPIEVCACVQPPLPEPQSNDAPTLPALIDEFESDCIGAERNASNIASGGYYETEKHDTKKRLLTAVYALPAELEQAKRERNTERSQLLHKLDEAIAIGNQLRTALADLTRQRDEAEDALSCICLLLSDGNLDPSDGEDTDPQQIVEMAKLEFTALRTERDRLRDQKWSGILAIEQARDAAMAQADALRTQLHAAVQASKDMHAAQAEQNDALRQRVAELDTAMGTAHETIRALHGPAGWPEYQHSPEMKQIRAALAQPAPAAPMS